MLRICVAFSLLAGVTRFGIPCASAADGFTWRVISPATTGIPGEEVRFVRFGPDQKLYVGARWPFWGDGGVGVLDRASDTWATYSNIEYSIPSEYVNDLEWSPDGTIAWLATDNGLVKWTGGTFTVYNTSNAPLKHNTIMNLDVDAEGNVWLNNSNVTSTLAAIYKFDGTSWTSWEVGAGLPWDPPWNSLDDILVDHLGHVWVTNQVLNGVAEFNGSTWTLRGSATGRFGRIAEATNGDIWLVAGVGGGNSFWRYNRSTFRRFDISTTPLSIGIDDDGAVFLGDWGGTIRKTTDGVTLTTWVTGLNHVYNIACDPHSPDLWIGTPGAVGHFDGAGTLLRDFNTYNTGMPDYFIEYFGTDHAGNFWMSSGEAGLSRFDGVKWRNWGAHNAGSEPYPFAGNEPMGIAFQDSRGTFWFGGNGIARWDETTGDFNGFWNWQNNPGMGVDLWPFFAEDMNGRVFAASEYGATYHFNAATQLWDHDSVAPYAVLGLPGMKSDSHGNVWIAAWFDIHKWDGATWTKVTLPNPNYFFDLGGINSFDIGPDDVFWFGTVEGLVRWDGATFTLFNRRNSPLPTDPVRGVAVRSDGWIGLTCSDYSAQTPFPNGAVIISGDIANPANWSIWSYGTSPIPHYQLGRCAFDAAGDFWISAVSEGTAVLDLPPPIARPGDTDGDGDVDLSDLGVVLAAYGACAGDPGFSAAADFDQSGCIDLSDLGVVLANYGT